MTPAQDYCQNVLAARLAKYRLKGERVAQVCTDVQQRLDSLLHHWNDKRFRRTLLVIGYEEAAFWKPVEADLDVRSLVVLAVRNSLIEDLSGQRGGLAPLLPDEHMPSLTAEAIRYFSRADLAFATRAPAEDLFGSLSRRFPHAWQALSVLSQDTQGETSYVMKAQEYEPLVLSGGAPPAGTLRFVTTASGIDSRVDPQLAEFLVGIQEKAVNAFGTPSFSRLTRNPEKLLGVIDHVLRHGATFMTANYVLAPDFVARRHPLVRSPHTATQARLNSSNLKGVTPRHAALLPWCC